MTTSTLLPVPRRRPRSGRCRRAAITSLGALLLALAGPAAAYDPPSYDVQENRWGRGLEVVHSGAGRPHCNGEVVPHGAPPRTRPVTLKPGGDLAFVGDLAVQLCGNDDGDISNDGFVVVDIRDPQEPTTIGRFACTASASDLAVVGHLVFLAVDRNGDEGVVTGPRGTGCAAEEERYSPLSQGLFKGIRVVDISNPRAPRLVANVPVAAGGGVHTVTALPEPAGGAVLVFASTPSVSLTGATTHESWVVRVPMGLPRGGPVDDPPLVRKRPIIWGNGTAALKECHDVALLVTPGRRPLATCNDVERGSLLVGLEGLWNAFPPLAATDEDALEEERTTALQLPALAVLDAPRWVRHHSAAFSYDGTVLVVSNESLLTMGGVGCAPTEQPDLGALSFYDLDPVFEAGAAHPVTLEPAAHAAPPPVVGGAWCSSVNFNIVPTRNGKNVLVAGWYAGGTSVVGFDRADKTVVPTQLAHFAAGTGDRDGQSATRGSYWYRGHVWVGNLHGCLVPGACFGGLERGIDVLEPERDGDLHDVLTADLDRPERVDVDLADADMGRQTCRYEEGRYLCT